MTYSFLVLICVFFFCYLFDSIAYFIEIAQDLPLL